MNKSQTQTQNSEIWVFTEVKKKKNDFRVFYQGPLLISAKLFIDL